MNKHIGLAFFAILFSFSLAAQQFDSRKIITKGIELFDKRNYTAAATEFLKVPMTDTNYLLAQYELVLTYANDSTQRDEALKLIAVNTKTPYNPYRQSLRMLGAEIYDRKKDFATSHKIYDDIIQEYPEYPQVYYEKAVVYMSEEKYEDAIQFFQKSLLRNPNHFRSHANLGKAYYKLGRIAEAVIATHFSLTTTDNPDQAGAAVNQLAHLVSGNDTVINRLKAMDAKYKDAQYDEISEVLMSRVATDAKYQLKTSIDDIITRQLQVVYELLDYRAGNNSFVNHYYIPYMQKIWKTNKFDAFMLFLFSDIGLKSIDKQVKKNKNDIIALRDDLDKYFTQISGTRELNYDKRKAMKWQYATSGQYLAVSAAEMIKEGKEEKLVFSGPFKYYEYGKLQSEGAYTNKHLKDGLWKYYNSYGILTSEESIKEGKLAGWEKNYGKNGMIIKEIFYPEDKGLQKMRAYENGYLDYTLEEVAKDKPLDYVAYHPNGQVRTKYKMKDDKPVDGELIFYHPNGKIASKLNSVAGNTEGAVTRYNENGTVIAQENYKKDALDGPSKYFYANGKLKEDYNFEKGVLEGEYKTYFLNGNVEKEGSFRKGKFHGTIKEYFTDGRLMATIDYKDGIVKDYKMQEPSMAKYNNVPKGKERFFFADGNLLSELNVNNKSLEDGRCNYYHYSGGLNYYLTFNDGKKQGKTESYYPNGATNTIGNYEDNLLQGKYITLTPVGDTTQVAHYHKGELHGVVNSYTNNKITFTETYTDGILNGPSIYYYGGAKHPYKTKWFNNGLLMGYMEFDKDGIVTTTETFKEGSGIYVTHHASGAEDFKVDIKNGRFQGKGSKKYFDGKTNELEEYNRGKLIGHRTMFYYNGDTSEHYVFDSLGNIKLYEDFAMDGKIERQTVYTDTPGYATTSNYIGGKLYRTYIEQEEEQNGPEIYYGPNQEVAGIINYDMGKIISYTYLDPSGKYVDPISLHGGVGKVQMYYQNGQKSIDMPLNKGSIEGEYISYYPDGKISARKFVKDYISTGKFEEFDTNGQLLFTATFNDKGEYDGPIKVYKADGTLVYESTFKNNERVGKCLHYNKKKGSMEELIYENNELVGAK